MKFEESFVLFQDGGKSLLCKSSKLQSVDARLAMQRVFVKELVSTVIMIQVRIIISRNQDKAKLRNERKYAEVP